MTDAQASSPDSRLRTAEPGGYDGSTTTRALAAIVILLGTAMPAPAKLLCAPGRFVVDTAGAYPAVDGRELVLGNGTVSVPGMCQRAPGRRFDRESDYWLYRVKARLRCETRSMTVRARWNLDDDRHAYCTRLEGVFRMGSRRRIPFVATRVVECGNRIREAGEQCDGQDGTFFGADCCGPDCRVKPGCALLCDVGRFPCEGPDQICVKDCSYGGVCRPRADVDCGTTPVCDCERKVTYANRCEAWDAGAGLNGEPPCDAP